MGNAEPEVIRVNTVAANWSAYRAVLFDIGGVLEITGPTDFGARWEKRPNLPIGAIAIDLSPQWLAGATGEIAVD